GMSVLDVSVARLAGGIFAVARPGELVGDDDPAAGGAARREELPDGQLEAGLAARRRRQCGERGVDVAEVRWPENDLREEPGQRARLEAEGPPLAIDRRARDPAAPAVEVGHDVAGRRVRLQARDRKIG